LMGWISCCCSPTTASLRLLILSAVFSHMHISQCFCELVSSHRYRRFPRGLDRHSFSGLTGHLRTSPSKESFETHHNYHTKQLLLQCCPSYWGGYTQLCPRKSQWDISMPSHCMWCLKSSDASWTWMMTSPRINPWYWQQTLNMLVGAIPVFYKSFLQDRISPVVCKHTKWAALSQTARWWPA
jgi:hypothetical protein